MTVWHHCLFAVIFLVILTGCSRDGKRWDPEDYTVKSGDTIFTIAWRYELDAEEFAAWNGFSSSKRIKPGMRLHTRKPENFQANRNNQQKPQQDRAVAYTPASALPATTKPSADANQMTLQRGGNAVSPPWVKAKKGDTLYGLSRRYDISVNRLAQLNQLKKPYVIQPEQTIFLKPLSTGRKTVAVTGPMRTADTSTRRQRSSMPTATSTSTASWPKTLRWQRPAQGKVVKRFDRRRNDAKGIHIAGKKGSAVVAAAAGKVVYSGNGLISYGNLIIIKHNRTFLSAYAYNRKLLVEEGDRVKAGQRIAEMGNKDKQSGMLLHFEIRKNGKPVDPLKYLPL